MKNGVIQRFFKESSEEERGHAEKLMEYQVDKIEWSWYWFMNLFFKWFWTCFLEQTRWKSNIAEYD